VRAGGRGRSRSKPSAVLLVGFMGAGKTTVGRALGEQLGWQFEDLDERIERRAGRTVPEIFRVSGESEFRRAEQGALRAVLRELRSGAEKIVALGGGAFAQKKNVRLIQAAGVPTVFLDAEIEELWRRCSAQACEQGVSRPLLGSKESFRELYQARRPHYSQAPFTQQTDGKTVEQIVNEVVEILGLDPSGGGRAKG